MQSTNVPNDIEQLFETAGFSDYYRNDTVDFYSVYFDDTSKMNSFFADVFGNEEKLNYTPRRMMNRVRYLVSFANNIESISSESDALRIVFLQACIEGLHKLSKSNAKHNQFFLKYCNEEDSQYIIKHFDIFDIAPCLEDGRFDGDASENYDNNMSLILFAEILKETRNIVLHEGDFWSVQLFNSKEDCGLLSSIQTDKKYIKDEILKIHFQYCDEETKKYFEKNDTLVKLLNSNGELMYSFDTRLDYQKFIAIFVRACISFITNYIHSN